MCRENNLKTFITVLEGSGADRPFVRPVRLVDAKGILAVDTENGVDTIITSFGGGKDFVTYGSDDKEIKGHFAVLSTAEDEVRWKFETAH